MITYICSAGILVLGCLDSGKTILWNTAVGYQYENESTLGLCVDKYGHYITTIRADGTYVCDKGAELSSCYCPFVEEVK